FSAEALLPAPLEEDAFKRKAASDVVAFALDRHRVALALRGPGAELGERTGRRRDLPRPHCEKQRAMTYEVRIASDRRCEMAVAGRAQAGVPKVPGRVVGLLQRPQDERLHCDPTIAPVGEVPVEQLRDRPRKLLGLSC